MRETIPLRVEILCQRSARFLPKNRSQRRDVESMKNSRRRFPSSNAILADASVRPRSASPSRDRVRRLASNQLSGPAELPKTYACNNFRKARNAHRCGRWGEIIHARLRQSGKKPLVAPIFRGHVRNGRAIHNGQLRRAHAKNSTNLRLLWSCAKVA